LNELILAYTLNVFSCFGKFQSSIYLININSSFCATFFRSALEMF